MNDKQEIHVKYMPTLPPIWPTLTTATALKAFNSPGWVVGCACTILAILWLNALVGMAKSKWVKPSEIR